MYKPGDTVKIVGNKGHSFPLDSSVVLLGRRPEYDNGERRVWDAERDSLSQLLWEGEDFKFPDAPEWHPIEYSAMVPVDGEDPRLYTVQWDGLLGKWALIDNEGDYGEMEDNRLGLYDTEKEAFNAFEEIRRSDSASK